ncbi:hypothetical protein HDU93_003468, partial [Gonapodya sp. JEL0774]
AVVWIDADGGDALAQTVLRQVEEKWTDRIPPMFANDAGFVEAWEKQRMEEYQGLLEILFLIAHYSGKSPPPSEHQTASTLSLDSIALPPPPLTPSLRVRMFQTLANSRFGLCLADSAAFGIDNQPALEDIVELSNLVFLAVLTLDVIIQDMRLDDPRTILSSTSDVSKIHDVMLGLRQNRQPSDPLLNACALSLLGWALLLVRFRSLVMGSSPASPDSDFLSPNPHPSSTDEFTRLAVTLGLLSSNSDRGLASPSGSTSDDTDPSTQLLATVQAVNVRARIVNGVKTSSLYQPSTPDRVAYLTTLKDVIFLLAQEFRLLTPWADALAEVYVCKGANDDMARWFWTENEVMCGTVLRSVMADFPAEAAVANKLAIGLAKGAPSIDALFVPFSNGIGSLSEVVRDVTGLQQRSFYKDGHQYQEVETTVDRRIVPGSNRFAVFVPAGTRGGLWTHESGYQVG